MATSPTKILQRKVLSDKISGRTIGLVILATTALSLALQEITQIVDRAVENRKFSESTRGQNQRHQEEHKKTVHVDCLISRLTPQAVDQPAKDSLPEIFGEWEQPSPIEPSLPPDDFVEETQDIESQLTDTTTSSQ